jgi:serine/threonine protein kinase
MNYPDGDLLPGTKYVVVKKLGQGGMGVVYEVVKEPKIRGVAKIIHPWLAADPEFRRRFFEEVRILAELDHPNIVRVMDYDQLADRTPFFVMELLHGSNVRSLLRRTKTIDPINLYRIMHGLLEGLAFAHSHEPMIVHRDVKSENVFIHIPAFGEPCIKLIDFGLAARSAEPEGHFSGTVRYASPEQLRGEAVTPRADLYSAGLILYEGLAGVGPFDAVEMVREDRGERRRLMARAHARIPAPRIRTIAPWVPSSLEDLLEAALAKDPRDRPESAYAFATKLLPLQFMSDKATTSTMTTPTLETLAQALPPSVRSPQGQSEGDDPEPSDTSVDSPLAFKDGVSGGEEPLPRAPEGAGGESGADVSTMDVQSQELVFQLGAAPRKVPPAPRSFAEAEAAAKRSGVIPSELFADLRAPKAKPGADAGDSRLVRTMHVRPQRPSGSTIRVRRNRLLLGAALALGLGLAVTLGLSWSRTTASGHRPPALDTSTPPAVPLPPPDPTGR